MIAVAWALVRRAAGAGGRFVTTHPLVAIILALWCVIGGMSVALHRARTVNAAQHLALLNARAAVDSSAQVHGIDAAMLRAVTRQAAQAVVQRDSLDRLLHLVPLAKARVDIVLPPTTIHATADSSRTTDSARIFTFDLRRAPYTAHADVTVPDDTTHRASIQLGIAVDTAALSAEMGCAGDTARVVFTAPPWLPLRVTGATQDPRLCQHIAPQLAPHPRRWHLTIGPGYGLVPEVTDSAGRRSVHIRRSLSFSAVVGWSPF